MSPRPTPQKRRAARTRNATRPLAVVVLAAGAGKRMRSRKAKVLHEVAGRTMLDHVLDAVDRLAPQRTVVVVGHCGDQVATKISGRGECVTQSEQLGTGHAVSQAKRELRGFVGDVLVLCGDVPLITSGTLRRLVATHRRRSAAATVLGMVLDDPTGYGRILVEGREAVRIVEHPDATDEERLIDEVNTGTYCFDSGFLFRSLGRLGRDNAQGEYYLPDLLAVASRDGRAAKMTLEDAAEGLGVNSRADLANAEMVMQDRLLVYWMDRGVTFLDPATAYLSAAAKLGRDTVIGPNVRIEGATTIGEDCVFDGSSYLRDTRVESGVHVRWGVVTQDAQIGRGVRIGPYAHLRPEASLAPEVHIGNFVEVKKSRIGRGSKANHLAYIGDATVGENANIGAGTITCNYDGFNKYRTTIGDRVQIGSDTQLVAPVSLGDDCYVAAGSTITRNVEAGALVYNDKRQMVRTNWVADFRERSTRRKQRRGAGDKRKDEQ
ncbi:MAG: bifunctional UDP-N-acetylglucosamine diphosphorylase/glucosamine-1-phosphate N-acetyltransferase GlmU [Myxococcales bacterium]|nr:MAG: bifunctional UDP-N-acetylglucosamine diphosphorylase/glucosamine-1-phosphate N-acetyltransferase GlmU [Myxococcales bacterium]